MSHETPTSRSGSALRRFFVGVLLHVVLPLCVLGGGYLVARHLIQTAPTTAKKHRERQARAVEVAVVERANAQPRIEAMGLVRPAREVTLRPRVSGEVVWVADAFEPGSRVAAEAELMRIDPADFDLAIQQAKASILQAETAEAQARASLTQAKAALDQSRVKVEEADANLKLEEGNQAVAKREYEMLEGTRTLANPELVLRTPQLNIARAAVKMAKAGVEAAVASVAATEAGVATAGANVAVAEVRLAQAELDRSRTGIQVPFDAWIRERHVELGSVIGTGTNVVTLIGTKTYWVEVALPQSELRWLRNGSSPDLNGAKVVIRDDASWGPDARRDGRVLRLLGDLETAGRLARLLVEVEDPLHLEATGAAHRPLLAGSYVQVEIDGHALEDVIALERAWLRHGDTVWIVDADGKLRIREVEVLWRGRDRVYLGPGIEAGDRVIRTDLAAPVDGMPVRVKEANAAGRRSS